MRKDPRVVEVLQSLGAFHYFRALSGATLLLLFAVQGLHGSFQVDIDCGCIEFLGSIYRFSGSLSHACNTLSHTALMSTRFLCLHSVFILYQII